MSYDLTIRAHETYSQATARGALDAHLLQLPGIQRNGEIGFVLDDPPARWMEIDLDVVSDDGDSLMEDWKTYDTTNCIRLHIPYQFLGDALESGYLPTAFAIAEFVGWPLYDEQTDRVLTRAGTVRKPWWMFWGVRNAEWRGGPRMEDGARLFSRETKPSAAVEFHLTPQSSAFPPSENSATHEVRPGLLGGCVGETIHPARGFERGMANNATPPAPPCEGGEICEPHLSFEQRPSALRHGRGGMARLHARVDWHGQVGKPTPRLGGLS